MTKTASKAPTKAPPKKRKATKPAPSSVFNLLGGDNVIQASAESLHALRSRRKNDPTNFRTLGEIKRNGIPIEHFYLQYFLGLSYIPSRCAIEIIGAEGIGKTTFVHNLIGMAARANVPSCYEETEGKPMMDEQVKRCLSTNRALADKIFERVGFTDVREIRQATKFIDEWVFDMRGRALNNKECRIPHENPLLVAVDTWSKLMSPGQAAGYFEHGDFMKADQVKNLKEVGEGSNLEHAKHAAWWCRRLPYLLHDHNVLLVLVSHQNAKIDMGGGTSYMSADTGKLYNKTKIGGNAFNQNCAIQIILAPGAMAKNGSNEVTGRIIRARVDKNSFGPDNRQIEYELRTRYTQDTAEFQESPLQLDEAMAKWFTDEHVLGTTAASKRFTCEKLGVIGGDATDLSKALHARPEVMAALAKDLCIKGYDDPVEEIMAPPPDVTAKVDPGLST